MLMAVNASVGPTADHREGAGSQAHEPDSLQGPGSRLAGRQAAITDREDEGPESRPGRMMGRNRGRSDPRLQVPGRGQGSEIQSLGCRGEGEVGHVKGSSLPSLLLWDQGAGRGGAESITALSLH